MSESQCDKGSSVTAVDETDNPVANDVSPLVERVAGEHARLDEYNKTPEDAVDSEALLNKQSNRPAQDGLDGKSPLPVNLHKQPSLRSSSPRMSLSLKKINITPKTAKRSLSMNMEGGSRTSNKFVLGVNRDNDGERESSLESQFQMPAFDVPNDSQFELSADSQTLFQIQRPLSTEPTAQPPISSSQTQKEQPHVNDKEEPPSALFAFVDPNLSSRQAIRKAKVSEQCQESPQLLSEQQNSDPYRFDSQNDQTVENFIREKRAKRISSIKDGSSKACTEIPPSTTDNGSPLVQVGAKQNTSEMEKLSSANGSTRPDESEKTVLPDANHSKSLQFENTTVTLDTTNHDQRSTSQSSSKENSECVHENNPSESSEKESQYLAQSQPRSEATTSSQPSQSLFSSPSLLVPSASTAVQVSSCSPSSVVPPSLVTELKRRAGVNRSDGYQLKLVKVVRTIVEERHVFSEVIEDDRVVQGSERSWIVSCIAFTCYFVLVFICYTVDAWPFHLCNCLSIIDAYSYICRV